MMFIVRTSGETPAGCGFEIKQTRATPALATGGTRDFFCEGDLDAARGQDLNVVPVHDGWYADDTGGGVAVWGQGQFWEVRDTPFHVVETSAGAPIRLPDESDAPLVEVRNAIFGV